MFLWYFKVSNFVFSSAYAVFFECSLKALSVLMNLQITFRSAIRVSSLSLDRFSVSPLKSSFLGTSRLLNPLR